MALPWGPVGLLMGRTVGQAQRAPGPWLRRVTRAEVTWAGCVLGGSDDLLRALKRWDKSSAGAHHGDAASKDEGQDVCRACHLWTQGPEDSMAPLGCERHFRPSLKCITGCAPCLQEPPLLGNTAYWVTSFFPSPVPGTVCVA